MSEVRFLSVAHDEKGAILQMRREFKIISIKKVPSSRRIDDLEVIVDVQVTKKWEMGDLYSKFEDEVTTLNLRYPIRNNQHFTSLMEDRITGEQLEMGHGCLRKLSGTVLDLIRKDE